MDESIDSSVISQAHQYEGVSMDDLDQLTPGELRELLADSRASITRDVKRLEHEVKQQVDEVKERVNDPLDAREHIMANPLAMLGAAFVVGFILGS